MNDDLTERVARVMCRERHPCWSIVSEIFETDHDRQATEFRDYARAAIAIALEKAARVVTEHYQELSTEHRLLLLNRAAAIRAMIPSGNDPAQDDTSNAE
jgi:hypothetical protein